jgi:hypothetical protein
VCAGNGLLAIDLVYSERQKRKGISMFRVTTRYRDGTKDEYECHGIELAKAWFMCRVNAARLEVALGRNTIAWVILGVADGHVMQYHHWIADSGESFGMEFAA